MTKDQLDKLSPEEKRVKIAEACGWKRITTDGFFIGESPSGEGFQGLPDYLNDLNAMHAAEVTLTERQIGDYEVLLREVVCGKSGFWYTPHTGEVFQVAHATAAQRAESFLLNVAP